MTDIRPISPIDISGLKPGVPLTELPKCELVDPQTLFVDGSYQRSIGEKGQRQIRRMIQRFCWTRFKPPICAYGRHKNRTVLMVLDGQHTAIAAASNPNVERIPVMIVDAPETSSQAAAFVGQNTDRLAVTPLQLHQAAVIAQDEDAVTVEQVCQRAGVTVLKGPAGNGRYRARETIAVTTVSNLVARQTAMGARRILEVLANADLAPITGHHIRAAEYLMTNKDYCQKFEPQDLTTAISDMFLTAEDDAKVMSHAHRWPFWKALAVVWFRKTKKRRLHLRMAA
ncbi:MAG: hypothetical protein EOS54_04535 [Mesorhizobium sp.]|uniref:hypothetical protein n=1 Tax=unclassified Mesorhizobium TaxID=325217 RepID=UPI000F757698|nr:MULTISPECIES: hypothetical protein [unclassified Mesorhizobium]AZO47115.1 hypothetical protein EJ073_04210 [Mesorhizobium sp. M4B.F.Ca.ET.058.02.1.1]RWC57768.1 MAG: hypothetical protein EOS54_04535 [Mesorhizobium sp.]RWD13849.1 MAG: hypothetical protein EOS74_17790 [Mesorhizobium sp.]RWD55563.1 MAG: hypothetical protein EOS75_16515 [Mesorhizobium sp.]TIU72337.1 MAG: hypothetical protein E5W25_00970 [Mesorhizobium sp.]